MTQHKERAHSKFSASGSERWLNCAASVALEEASPPGADSPWAKEGTLAHEVLEARLLSKPLPDSFDVTQEMLHHVERAYQKIKAVQRAFGGTLLVEKKVFATFIHPEMFGTLDSGIAGFNRTLHIMDFKYGQGHVVDPKENTQLIQYALSVAESYGWGLHFDHVKMWILQPRAGGEWAKHWTITMKELETHWLPVWQKGVARVLKNASAPFPGTWCHWCRAKTICPAKNETRAAAISEMFESTPITKEGKNGLKEKSKKESGQKGREEKGQSESETCAREENSFAYRKAIRGR